MKNTFCNAWITLSGPVHYKFYALQKIRNGLMVFTCCTMSMYINFKFKFQVQVPLFQKSVLGLFSTVNMDRKTMKPRIHEKILYSNVNNTMSYHILFNNYTVEEELSEKVQQLLESLSIIQLLSLLLFYNTTMTFSSAGL